PTPPRKGQNGRNGRIPPGPSVNGCRGADSVQSGHCVPEQGKETCDAAGVAQPAHVEVVGIPAPACHLARTAADLRTVLAACDEAGLVGVDTETTGLDPRTDSVRLLSLAPHNAPAVFIIDLFAIDGTLLAPLLEVLARKRLVGHNLLFDLPFLVGLEPER